MKIGILDIDCHASKKKWGATVYPNLALCKIAAWHKSQGDEVEWATPFEYYDIIYRSKIFNFSADDLRIYNFGKEVRGGTGYDIKSKLPQEVDEMQPDFSIYPNIPEDTSFGFLTRCCPNRCKWCVVPTKEGAIRPYWDIDRVANGRKKVVLMDNNILAAGDYCLDQLQKIIDRGYIVDFNQALDARLVSEQNAKLLAKIKWITLIRFGCDTTAQIKDCERAISLINAAGYKGQYFLYTMLTSNFAECYQRTKYWWERNQGLKAQHKAARIYCHAQPYRDPYNPKHEPPQWQLDIAQWCNKKQYFDQFHFDDFEVRKGFKCDFYKHNLL